MTDAAAPPSNGAEGRRVAFFGAATATLLFQSAHHLEHVAQVMQVLGLGRHPAHARGLLGAHTDLEWVHAAYNWALEAFLVGLLLLALRWRVWTSLDRLGRMALLSVVALQGFHAFEHGLKMAQYLFVDWYRWGYHPPPGWLPQATGWPIFVVHFWLNQLVWALVALAWWAARPSGLGGSVAGLTRLVSARRLATGGALLALLAGLALRQVLTVHVPGEAPDLRAAVEASLPAGTIVLAPGSYEPVVVTKPLTIRAAVPGTATIAGSAGEALVEIRRTHDVTIHGLELVGGRVGIYVRDAQLVRIRANRIVGQVRAGVQLISASAEIVGNEIEGTLGPHGMGIELGNTHSRPPSTIAYNRVSDHALAGIELHNAEAQIVGNLVTGNGLRGISVAEMSVAEVRENQVLDNADAGIYVVDMSHAEVVGNTIRGVRPGPLGWAHGIRVEYHAEALLEANRILVPEPQAVVLHSGGGVLRR